MMGTGYNNLIPNIIVQKNKFLQIIEKENRSIQTKLWIDNNTVAKKVTKKYNQLQCDQRDRFNIVPAI